MFFYTLHAHINSVFLSTSGLTFVATEERELDVDDAFARMPLAGMGEVYKF